MDLGGRGEIEEGIDTERSMELWSEEETGKDNVIIGRSGGNED